MDDLNSTISSILGDPGKMDQLRSVAESLGINTGGASPPPQNSGGTSPSNSGQNGGIDTAAITSILQNFSGGGGNGGGGSPPNGAGMPNLDAVTKIAGIMSTFNQSDKNVDLLRSLKPHFNPVRAGRIDDAVRIMQIMRAWPALRDSGLLNSLGNLGGLGNLFGGGTK